MKNEAPDWLKRTQEASWEPEILISGISLLALFQLPELITQAHIFVEDYTLASFQYGNVDDGFFTLLETAVYWLITCLIIHLGLRSIWVSFVGLSYAFPDGISFNNLKITSYYKSKLLRIRSFEESVIRLEKISSMMYATAFMLVLATIGVSFYLTFWVVLINLFLAILQNFMTVSPYWDSNILLIIILITGVPYFIDFITLGWLKRFRLFAKIYRPVYNLLGILTLAPFYRGIYYGLISNIKRRYIFAGVFAFILVTFFLVISLRTGSLLDRTKMINFNVGYTAFEGYYRDLNPNKPSRWATIGSSEVDNGVLQLILSHKAAQEDYIKDNCGYAERVADGEELISLISLDCLSEIVHLEIDSIPIKPERWFFADYPGSSQRGISTWIRTDTISNGVHQLNVLINDGRSERNLVASIPFFNLSGKSFSKSKTIELPETIESQNSDSLNPIRLPIKQDL